MLIENRTKVYEGEVQEDIYGSWSDCDPGVYVGCDRIDGIIDEFLGKHVRVTIEILEPLNYKGETP